MSTCPVCKGALARTPKRKTKCPLCGDFLYVKYRPGEKWEQRQVVGSKEAQKIEREWKEHYAFERSLQLQSELMNAFESGRMSQYHKLLAVDAIRRGEDPAPHQRNSFTAKIQEAAAFQVGVEVSAKDKLCCEACRALHGWRFDTATALDNCVFPTAACTRPGQLCPAMLHPDINPASARG